MGSKREDANRCHPRSKPTSGSSVRRGGCNPRAACCHEGMRSGSIAANLRRVSSASRVIESLSRKSPSSAR
eukprot:6126852-Karenia_brevis.AAC.1